MQSIERFVQEQCGGNTIAAAYWLRISENKLIELLGIGEDSQLPKKLLNRLKQLEGGTKTINEVRALENVIEDLMANQERLVAEAERIINIYTKDNT